MLVKTQLLEELDDLAEKMKRMEPEKSEEIQIRKAKVDERFTKIQTPIEARKRELMNRKETF